ncbi:ABC transporter substrate-binding protein [Bacillus sp. ISL-51]|uniref:ABC transporter substrate-binding protein n=1 Tax=Bacteria TaxID=2 RepID=UPI001BEAD019|nr:MULTISPECIES: ABC transporter substrate-binding protein [Bacteria]MBT2573919.1 ABC transporter substrate-binding protein [Bacillus sp. ISL-51]MBT2634750.1 ABC transporter substrate-binding protein [Bacillus sp. ISL-26]MBT2712225.1 ABC transporter substrate-binding protein [Pseudomonas sp. ISL-88]
MKTTVSVLMISMFILLLSACSLDEQDHQVTVKHDLGTAHMAAHPKRVVVLEIGFIDALLDLGIKPVGAADDNKPKQLINQNVLKKMDGYTSVGTRSQPSLETIAALKPDLIIADMNRHKGMYDQLKQIAPTIALKNADADYQDTVDASLTIAKAVGKEGIMEKKLSAHEEKLSEVKRKLDAEGQSILIIENTNDRMTAKEDQFFTSRLMTLAGYTYAIGTSTKSSGGASANMKLTPEKLFQINPDYIVLIGGKPDKAFEEKPLWRQLSAVKNGHVFNGGRKGWSLRRSVDGADAILDDLENMVPSK